MKHSRELLLILFFAALPAWANSSGPKPSASYPRIVSFKTDFDRFWQQAKSLDLEHQILAWDQLIEKPHQNFYDQVVWIKDHNPNWAERKHKLLSLLLPRYPAIHASILHGFATLGPLIREQISAIRKLIPDARLQAPVYEALSPTFDGRTALLGKGDGEGQPILALGLDTLALGGENARLLITHELFHIYHAETDGIKEDGYTPGAKMLLPLWAEGLATYVSGDVTGIQDEGTLLFEPELGKVSDQDTPWLASQFLTIAEQPAVNPQDESIYKKWFNTGTDRLRADLPYRCGYLLGLRVVRHLARKHSLQEMIHWKADMAYPKITHALQELSRTQPLQKASR